MSQHGAELLELVYAAPDHAAHRLVYADWLMSQGDPRGEFINLQFKRETPGGMSRADEARERALIEAHGHAWLGSLARVVTAPVFRRGFLSECAVRFRSSGDRQRVRDAREWATVEKLAPADAEILWWPSLRSVWSLGPVHMNIIAGLRERQPLERIREARLDIQSWTEENRWLVAWALPGLQRLELLYPDSYTAEWRDFQPHSFASLLGATSAPGLHALRIRKRVLMSYPRWRVFTASRPDLAAWAEAALKCSNQVSEIRLEPCHGWSFSLVREYGGPWRVEIDWHTASASADPKTLELALSRHMLIRKVHARIHGPTRLHHHRILERILSYSGRYTFTIEALG